METISIEKQKLMEAYIKAQPKEQELLEALCGKETFIKPSPLRLPSTWEEVCKIKNIDPVSSLPYTNPANKAQKWLNVAFILYTVLEVLNTDSSGKVWEPDWSNASEYKYWPWFDYTAGVGFSVRGTLCDYTATAVGSRLCFKTKELAEYAGMAFIQYYRDFVNH